MLLGSLTLSLIVAMTSAAADYGLVINNGRVMDPGIRYDEIANVCITGAHMHVCHISSMEATAA